MSAVGTNSVYYLKLRAHVKHDDSQNKSIMATFKRHRHAVETTSMKSHQLRNDAIDDFRITVHNQLLLLAVVDVVQVFVVDAKEI